MEELASNIQSNSVDHHVDQAVANSPSSPGGGDLKADPSRRQAKMIPMADSMGRACLSKYQQLIRSAIEYFEVAYTDAFMSQRREVQPFRVGLRCKYCGHRAANWRPKGSVSFPTRVSRIYNAVQIMARTHLLDSCDDVPESFKARLRKERAMLEPTRGGKLHWQDSARRKGLYETEEGLFFVPY